MMDDCIKRQATIDALCQDWCGTSNADCKNPFDPATDDYYYCDGCGEVELIKALPSADVIEVVRCKDCIHFEEHKNYGDLGESAYTCAGNMNGWIYPDSYCSMGERRDG